MTELPSYLSAGQQARLFSSLKLSNKEQIATATLLAVFRLVPELLSQLISDTGVRINDRTKFDAYTEVNLAKTKTEKKDRPDGFICVKNRNEWTALVEAKVGNSSLSADQVVRYAEDAKANGINAVITISNEFTPRVEQSPINISKRLLTKVKLYHLSWRLILSTAILMRNRTDIDDREKLFVLEELIRFLRDDSVGNKSFTMMPSSWVEICSESTMGAKLRLSDERVESVSNALVEEFSEIALNLTDHLGVDCSAKIPSNFMSDRTAWQKSIARSICDKRSASCSFNIPNAAESLDVQIDLAKNSISVGMEIRVPEERTTIGGKINWVMRQLRNTEAENSFIKVRWKSRAADEFIEMQKIDANYFQGRQLTTTILSLTPMMQVHSSRLFNSRKNFITELEATVVSFYDLHAQYLKQWQPKAPKPLPDEDALD